MKQQASTENDLMADFTASTEKCHVQQNRTSQKPVSQGRFDRRSVAAGMLSMLLLRFANRVSFVLLSFYLGEHFASATTVALILETFYITELTLAPLVGNLSDRVGRKPFLLLAPLLGIGANLCLLIGTLLFPNPAGMVFDTRLLPLFLLILAGRLLEGTTSATSVPALLGFITDKTAGSERLQTRVMTLFEIAMTGGIALGIPFGGKISSRLGTSGFLVVIILHLINSVIIGRYVQESFKRIPGTGQQRSWSASLSLLREKYIRAFLPAWLAINILIGSWMTLIILLLTYPDAGADLRHPGQLLYGGFSTSFVTSVLGGFGLVFLIGMGLWLLLIPRLRRTTVMLMGLAGLGICIVALTIINTLPEKMEHFTSGVYMALFVLVPLVILGTLLLSGFLPTALTQMASIAEAHPHKRGAIMGLYSVVLGVGQMLGTVLGGLAVDIAGFYGLMIFSALLGLLALASVLYMRIHKQDITSRTMRTIETV